MAMSEDKRAKFEQVGSVLKKYFSAIAEVMELNHDPTKINEDMAVIATWKPDGTYTRWQVTVDPEDGYPYFALHDHRAADYGNKNPRNDTTLWRICHGTSAETARPFEADSANLYYKGHWCTFAEKVWCYIGDVPSAYSPADYSPYWKEFVE